MQPKNMLVRNFIFMALPYKSIEEASLKTSAKGSASLSNIRWKMMEAALTNSFSDNSASSEGS